MKTGYINGTERIEYPTYLYLYSDEALYPQVVGDKFQFRSFKTGYVSRLFKNIKDLEKGKLRYLKNNLSKNAPKFKSYENK